MTTKIEVYNRALDMVGEPRLASLDQLRLARHALDDAYDFVLQHCLEQGMWAFAMRTSSITATTLPSIDYGFSSAFNVPADLVHAYLLGADETCSPPLDDALQADGYFFARQTPLFCRYVSNDANYGGDLSEWPNVFAKYVIAELASEVVFTLTRSGELTVAINEAVAMRLAQARATDAVMASTGLLPYNALARRELVQTTDVEEPFPFMAVPPRREAQ